MPTRRPIRPVRRWTTFTWSASGFVLLGLCVQTRLLDGPDRWLRDRARPLDVWGLTQIRSSYVVDGFRPVVTAALLAALIVTICLTRRSFRPAVLTAASCAVAATATLLVKLALGRPDPHGALSGSGGSFPSGHTITVVVCTGLAIWVVRRDAAWWGVVASAAAGVVMGTALVLEGAHWTSDVVGGLLLGVAVLSAAKATGLPAWCAQSRPGDGQRD